MRIWIVCLIAVMGITTYGEVGHAWKVKKPKKPKIRVSKPRIRPPSISLSKLKSLVRDYVRKAFNGDKGRFTRAIQSQADNAGRRLQSYIRSRIGGSKLLVYRDVSKLSRQGKLAQAKRLYASRRNLFHVPTPKSTSSLKGLAKGAFQSKGAKFGMAALGVAAVHVGTAAIGDAIDCTLAGKTGSAHRACFNSEFAKDNVAARWTYEILVALAMLPIENMLDTWCGGKVKKVISKYDKTGTMKKYTSSLTNVCSFVVATTISEIFIRVTYSHFQRSVWRQIAPSLASSFN